MLWSTLCRTSTLFRIVSIAHQAPCHYSHLIIMDHKRGILNILSSPTIMEGISTPLRIVSIAACRAARPANRCFIIVIIIILYYIILLLYCIVLSFPSSSSSSSSSARSCSLPPFPPFPPPPKRRARGRAAAQPRASGEGGGGVAILALACGESRLIHQNIAVSVPFVRTLLLRLLLLATNRIDRFCL